jgi:hypothetical protein
MKIRKAALALRNGHAVRRRAWVDPNWPNGHPTNPGQLEYVIVAEVSGLLITYAGAGDHLEFTRHAQLSTNDLTADDWEIVQTPAFAPPDDATEWKLEHERAQQKAIDEASPCLKCGHLQKWHRCYGACIVKDCDCQGVP